MRTTPIQPSSCDNTVHTLAAGFLVLLVVSRRRVEERVAVLSADSSATA